MTVVGTDQGREVERASTIELFLDLVFVFTVTQLTEQVAHPHDAGDYGQAALILMMTFWMYDGFVWLTGNVTLDRPARRIALFAGMAGFLLMAMAIPGAFGSTEGAHDSGIVFGLAFIGVNLVHAGMFTTAPNQSAQAIWRIAPFNLTSAGLVLLAGFVDRDWRWLCWLAAVLVVSSTTLFRRHEGWSISAAHFVERHGLVIIVALGESIVAIGVGASGLEIDLALAAAAVLALALSAALWWVYFDRDDATAEQVMRDRSGDSRGHLGMWLAYTHLVMVAGIVVMAAGVKVILAHPTDAVESSTAWNLAAGIAVYLAGEATFRYGIGLGIGVRRLVTAALLVLSVPVGTESTGMLQLTVALGLVVALLVVEAVATRPVVTA
jgi:low temperature requirement protein LtrA